MTMAMFSETRTVEGVTIDVPIACPSLVPVYAIDITAVDVTAPRRQNPGRILAAYHAGRYVGRAGVTDAWRAEHPRGGFWCRTGPEGATVHSDRLQARAFKVLAALAAE